MKYRKYECVICGYIYDEELGDPEDGLAPGTRWEDIPDGLGMSGMWRQ